MQRTSKRRRGHGHGERNFERSKVRTFRREHKGGFACSHCRQWVVINEFMGTANRNHCNLCLWSKHVDEHKGDWRATCQAGMRPVALTTRIEGSGRRGELMLVHACAGCDKLSINRIAADDAATVILAVFEASLAAADQLTAKTAAGGILVLAAGDRDEVNRQLFGLG
jgi:hypothetical protein